MEKKTITCDYCGKKIKRFPSKIKETYNFCTRRHGRKFRVESPYKTISCDNCNTSFEKKAYKIEQDDHNFCSKECAKEFREMGKKKVQCAQCGKTIERWPYQIQKQDKHFCSKECEGAWLSENNTGSSHPNYTGKVEVECSECGETFKVYPYRKNNESKLFCSKGCELKWRESSQVGPDNPNWKGGSVSRSHYYGPNWNKQRKKTLERDAFTCQRCGSKKNLECHHIIPFRKFRFPECEGPVRNALDEFDWKRANNSKNLITVCNKCHRIVEGDEEFAIRFTI